MFSMSLTDGTTRMVNLLWQMVKLNWGRRNIKATVIKNNLTVFPGSEVIEWLFTCRDHVITEAIVCTDCLFRWRKGIQGRQLLLLLHLLLMIIRMVMDTHWWHVHHPSETSFLGSSNKQDYWKIFQENSSYPIWHFVRSRTSKVPIDYNNSC